MIEEILHCKTHFEVLGIIDRKIALINKKNHRNALIKQFVDKSLSNLKHRPAVNIEAEQWAKIRAAISHLENMKLQHIL